MAIIPGLEGVVRLSNQEGVEHPFDPKHRRYLNLPEVGSKIFVDFCVESDLVVIKRAFDYTVTPIGVSHQKDGLNCFRYACTVIARHSIPDKPKTRYPGNTVKIVRFKKRALTWWELGVVIQNDNMFVTQQEAGRFNVFRQDRQLVIPEIDRWWQFRDFAKEHYVRLGWFDALPDVSQHVPVPKPKIADLEAGQALVLWYNNAFGHGILLCENGQEVHVSWRDIVLSQPKKMAFLQAGRMVSVGAIEEVEFKGEMIKRAREVKRMA